jgi:2',3'-cyclic-nucleotide 2'-phosphodiesterase (5'-nucleotidase family)
MRKLKYCLILFSCLVLSCTSVQHISKMNVSYDVPSKQTNPTTDETIRDMVEPYKSQLDEKMNQVLANVGTELSKKQPESTLGNWATDAMMAGVHREGLPGDFAVCNYGGLRMPVITVGPLTIGEIYELSPFDNTIMIVDMPGNLVDTLFQFIADRNGWPVSDNIRMTMKGGKMLSCEINGKPIDPNAIYKAVLPDYVANGGDDARFMIGLKRIQTGLLQRDLIIQYAAETAKMGKDINVALDGRIVYQK